jgi:hypothetical protein
VSRGWVLDFDGVGGYAEAFHHARLDQADTFEIEFEMRATDLSGNRTILSKGAGGPLIRVTGSVIQLLKQGSGVIAQTSPGAVTAGAWHHVNVWKDGVNVGLAVDLRDLTEVIGIQTLVNTAESLWLGALVGGGEYFKGQLKDLRFWTGPRTPEQRVKYKTRPLIPEDPYLQGWWPMSRSAEDKVLNRAN